MTGIANGSAPAAPAAAPSAPAAPAAPASPRATVSNFMQAMEAKNSAAILQPAPPPAPAPAPPKPVEQPLLGEPPANDNAPAEPETPGEPAPEQPAEPETILQGDAELLTQAREWQNSDYLPEAFLGKLVEVEIKLDDGSKRTELVTAKEMRDGYLRQSALSRAQTRIHHERQQMQARDANVRAHFEKIQNPEAFLQEYEDRGYGPVLEQVALRIAERRVNERNLIEAAGLAAQQRFGCDPNDRRVWDAKRQAEQELIARRESAVELRRAQAERDALQARAKQDGQQADVSAMAATMRKQLDQLRPIAFKAFRVHDNASTQRDFARHLLAQMEVAGSYEVTRDAVMTAARTLAEELEDARAQSAAATAPRGTPPKPKPLSPTAAVAGRAVANGATRTRKRPSDLMADLYGKP